MEPTSRIVISPEQDPSMTGFGGGLPQETFVIHDSIVVTSGQLQKCLMKMGPLLDRSLENLVSWRLSFGDNQQLCGQDDQDDYEPYFAGQGNSHSSLKGFVEHAMSALDSLKKNNSHHTKASLQGGRKKDGPNNKRIQDFLTIQDIKKEVERLEPDFDPALINMIAKVLNGDLIQNLRDRNRSIVLDQVQGEEKDEEIEAKNTSGNKAVSSAIASLSKRIELSSQGIDVFEVELLDLVTLYTANLNKAASSASELAETLKLVNQSFMKYHCQADVTPSSNTAQVPFSLSAEEASLLVELVPQKVSDTLKKMRRSTAGSGKQKNLTEYLGLWSSLRKDLGFELNTTATDQLNDSLFLAEHMKGLRKVLQEITSSIDHALMLHIVALIAFQKWTGHMLHASGKYVPRVIRQLRVSIEMSSGDSTAKEQLDVLEKALEAILSNVKQQQLHSSEGQDPSNKQMEIDRLLKDTRNLGLSLSSPIL
ncbi:hypothetical protein BX616_007208 [Lobosporangium transversale]|nr:hypothetical protein BX616_007208 [Lobosporangium transversale]